MKRFALAALSAAIPVFAVLAETWDFTAGRPVGLRPFPNADSRGSIGNRYLVLPEAFRLSAEFTPCPSAATNRCESMLFDNMRVNYRPKRNNHGIQLALVREGEWWTSNLYIGYGDDTVRVTGPRRRLVSGEPTRVSFLYGADRRVRWDFAGETCDSPLPRGGSVAQGKYLPTFAERGVAIFHPLEGQLRKLSIDPVERTSLAVYPAGRASFERAERSARLELAVENLEKVRLDDIVLKIRQVRADGACAGECERRIERLEAGMRTTVDVPVETRLRPGVQRFLVTGSARRGDGRVASEWPIDTRIGPTFADRMPSVLWGMGSPAAALAEFGFTHGVAYSLGSRGPGDDPMRMIRELDAAMAAGVRLVRTMGPSGPPGVDNGPYMRRTRDGKNGPGKRESAPPVFEVSHPDVLSSVRARAAKGAAFLTPHPALAGILPCSEMRDRTFPSFNTEADRYRRETGRTVPDEVSNWVADEDYAERFAAGVVPEDDPVLAYYRWFWGGGDGWPTYTGTIAEEYRRLAGRYGDGSERQRNRPFFSFFDPAVRCPPVWGSGGDVDVLSQWDYTVPEPLNVAGPAEELFAMASGRPGQQVMMMTQLICYRSQIAPSNVVVSSPPAWIAKRPRAGFPSIPPDSLQEATWAMLAKPVKGVMYHGWGTIAETGNETGYCFTNPETAVRMRQLLKETVAPLGPFLKELGRRESPVAVLESATTCLMGGPASWGWVAPAITFLQRARLDPRVVYEQTILRDGLGATRVLYAPQCRFLTPPVIEAIRQFQAKGGLLVGDGEMLPALRPDVVVPVVSFEVPPSSDHAEDVDAAELAKGGDGQAQARTVRAKKTMQRQAEDLRRDLAAKGYSPSVDSTTSEIVVFARQWKDVPYVFAVNDCRTFGDYVGQWGLTMERGLPCRGEVRVRDPQGRTGAVYELSRGGELAFSREKDGTLAVPLDFATNDGRVLAFLPGKICSVKLEVPEEVERGGCLTGVFRLLDAGGSPIPAILPVDVRVSDASGRELDGAGWSRAEDGVCRFSLPLNLDDEAGAYTVVCRDRASGLSATAVVRTREAAATAPDRVYPFLTKDGRRLVGRQVGTNVVYELVATNALDAALRPMRQWKLYVVKASHTDIGLHNSQYVQRQGAVRRIEEAMRLVDADRRSDDDPAAFRYVMEGVWFWENYPMDRGEAAAWNVITNYVRRGRLDIGATCAGNHTHVYGPEEIRRSALTRARLREKWGVGTQTMIMADNPGMSWSLVAPYAAAGIRNVVFAPNHWNPIPSTIRKMNRSLPSSPWNPDARGGGAYIDVCYDSERPMVFKWQSYDRTADLLVWCSTAYGYGLERAGITPQGGDLQEVERKLPAFLEILEGKYPYDVWLACNYRDDEEVNVGFADFAAEWNAKWEWPRFVTVGRLDEPFDELRKRFDAQIPVVRGEMTTGWLQSVVSAPELLAAKLDAERLLASAERAWRKDPARDESMSREIDRAWWYLILNDEHSYGVSGYKGRRVFETWMQHRDWIERAAAVARQVGAKYGLPQPEAPLPDESPSVQENEFLRVRTNDRGEIESIYDKELGRELLNGVANRFLYTRDNHQTWADERQLGAKITRKVFLPKGVRRIEIEDVFEHARDLFNDRRYYRYGYLAFPFSVPNGVFRACLGGGETIDPYRDQCGYTTDAFVAVRDWCAVENAEYGVALYQRDSMLTEFGEIHPDKTCFTGRPPEGKTAVYSYLFTDWLQMHHPDGESMNFRFRYSIVPYVRGHEPWRTSGEGNGSEMSLTAGNFPESDGEWTGLIEAPRASHGEKDGQLYLLWGADLSPSFSHYELYRDGAFVTNVFNEVHDGIPYRVARFEDLGLETHSRHAYRLRKVMKDGTKGELSGEFVGLTRQKDAGEAAKK